MLLFRVYAYGKIDFSTPMYIDRVVALSAHEATVESLLQFIPSIDKRRKRKHYYVCVCVC